MAWIYTIQTLHRLLWWDIRDGHIIRSRKLLIHNLHAQVHRNAIYLYSWWSLRNAGSYQYRDDWCKLLWDPIARVPYSPYAGLFCNGLWLQMRILGTVAHGNCSGAIREGIQPWPDHHSTHCRLPLRDGRWRRNHCGQPHKATRIQGSCSGAICQVSTTMKHKSLLRPNHPSWSSYLRYYMSYILSHWFRYAPACLSHYSVYNFASTQRGSCPPNPWPVPWLVLGFQDDNNNLIGSAQLQSSQEFLQPDQFNLWVAISLGN